MNRQVSFSKALSGTFLIAGTMIGAGMLGIPLVTAGAGFFPGLVITLLVWLFMYATGLLFLEVTLWMPDGSNVLSITKHFMGKGMRLFSGGMFLFLYYCLLVAYFAAGSPLLGDAFHLFGFSLTTWQAFTLFALIFGAIVAIGPKSIDRVNIIMSVGMIGSWLILIGSGSSEVASERLSKTHWPSMIFALPVMFSAFGFHNVIPSLCTYLKRDRKALRLSIFWGTLLPLIVYLIWQWLIIGAIPGDVLEHTLEVGAPVTVAFHATSLGSYFIAIGRFFAFFAIVTSVLGVSFSMVDFLGDGMRIGQRHGWKRVALTCLALGPPFVLAGLNPDIFALALGIAGGFGEAFLNGILPVALLWIGKYRFNLKSDLHFLGNRSILALLIFYGLFVMGLETFLGLSHYF